jgi:hypothetical protein
MQKCLPNPARHAPAVGTNWRRALRRGGSYYINDRVSVLAWALDLGARAGCPDAVD